MYCLSQKQIDFILNDIRARGVEMESLQLNLLDHVCCMVEQNLEENGDFESFYFATIKTFYKEELREIEEETINLLTFKNYYIMKKIMIISGAMSAILLCLGIAFKFERMEGAAALLTLGIVCFSLVFLPLVFTLKVKEKQGVKDKLIIGLGTLSAILLSMGILFKIMHWPGANVMGLSVLAIMGLVFLPIYFFSGIRHPETKINTIVSSVLIVGGCGLFLSLVRSPAGTRLESVAATSRFVRNEQILKTEQRQIEKQLTGYSSNTGIIELSAQINSACEDLKALILESETGHKSVDADFDSKNILISDALSENYFGGAEASGKLAALKQTVEQYNATSTKLNAGLQSLPLQLTVFDVMNSRVITTLNDLIQMQMAVLQNEKELIAVK